MYENMTIVQYDRGNLGEFICLSLYKKYFNVDLYDSKRQNGLGWFFMGRDATLDCFLYDYHRPNVESVKLQRAIFGTCVYEELLAKNYEDARRITHAMINYRKSNPDVPPEQVNMIDLSDPDYSYDSSSKILTRIHIFDDVDMSRAFPGAEIINVYCPPEKRWIFKFLFMYKKHLDSVQNNQQRTSNGVDEFWNFNWVRNLEYKEGLTNINVYDMFIGKSNDLFDSTFTEQLLDNFEANKAMLELFNLDYKRNNVTSDELLPIIRSIYSDYL